MLFSFRPVCPDLLFYGGGFNDKWCRKEIYRPKKPLMWSARLKVDTAYFFGLEKDFYSTGKYFSPCYGGSFGQLATRKGIKDQCFVLSSYLGLKFFCPLGLNARLFLFYSPGGPSLLSNNTFVETSFSNRFVFTDQLGVGVKWDRNFGFEMGARLYHFSNGDIFPINGGIDVPIMFYLGVYR